MRETEPFTGTKTQEIVDGLDTVYQGIESAQSEWKRASPYHCPDGCGTCCVDFEPDVLECEALYLAAWMIYHQPGKAAAILNDAFISPRADPERGCMLFDPVNPYHCTVYGGRALICRLFGYTGDRGKDGKARWKPCKWIPIGAPRPQYSEDELLALFGAIPPIMSDITSQAVALSPDSAGDRRPLREALKDAIAKIQMLSRFCTPVDKH